MIRAKATGLLTIALLAPSAMAHAACPQELAVYADADKTLTVEFTPGQNEAASTSHLFKMVMANDIVLDGVVIWSGREPRPDAILMHNCPEGDVTGDELAACTIWQGVVYSADQFGNVNLLPPEGADAAEQLVFPDLGRTIRMSPVWGDGKVTVAPWDVLALAACQE